MNRYMAVLIAFAISLFTLSSFAFTPPKPDGYVMDVAGKLTTEQRAQLNSKLDNLNKTTKNELAALIIPSMDGENIEDIAQATFKAWGVGKAGLDNGVLVVLSIAERKSRIQTGKGVEGDLTDLQCNDILRKTLAPFLKRGDFYGGLDSTFNAISSTLESRAKAVAAPPPPSTQVAAVPPPVSSSIDTGAGGIMIGGLILLLTVGAIGLLVAWFSAKENKKRLLEEEKLERELSAIRRQREVSDRIAQQNAARARHALEAKRYNAPPVVASKPPVTKSSVIKHPGYMAPAIAVGVAASIASTAEVDARKAKAERDRRDEEARRKRQQDDEDDRRRRDSYSSSSSSSSYDSGSSSSFGGGDSGGGGSSGDW